MGFDWVYLNPFHEAGFSGSLYAMTLTGITKLGMVTPLGGLAFLGSWATLGFAALKSRRR